jgi:hypothetical protein
MPRGGPAYLGAVCSGSFERKTAAVSWSSQVEGGGAHDLIDSENYSDSVASFPVCKTSDDTARLYKLAVTAMAVFMDEHGCDFIPAGTEVTVEDFSLHGSFCVRQTGNPDCYWIPQEFLITPEVNQKWQENKESKVEAIKEFDKQHPECKDRETNLNLPEHCH